MAWTGKAQLNTVSGAAGTDFYFTTFKHSEVQGLILQIIVAGSNATTATYSVNGKVVRVQSDRFMTSLGKPFQSNPGDVVHITTSEPCFMSAFVVGSTCGAETSILPTRLLGTSYMLQGTPGSLIELNGALTQTYSQFSVVGTTDHTNITIQSPVNLTCITTGQTIPAEERVKFAMMEGQALFFQPLDYTNDISGVRVKANHPVAVFQGNNLTRIPTGADWADYTWEQARPTTEWGTEFIVPKSSLFRYNITRVTALEDNTEVYRWDNGMPVYVATLQSGQTYSTPVNTNTPQLAAIHLQTSKPACCYLYFTGSTQNDGVGDPSMVEIAPIDRPSTNTRWIMANPADNAPYKTRVLVTFRADNIANILLNGLTFRSYEGESVQAVITDEYVTYEMAYSTAQSMILLAQQGGFSAYTLHVGQVSESSAFNLALHETPPPVDLCLDGQLLFKEDFGGNDPSDPTVSTTPVAGMSSAYRQITNLELKGNSQDMGSGKYLVTKRGYRNASDKNYSLWHIMDDHTYWGDTTRGYFLEVDGKGGNDAFFSTTLTGLCAGSQLSFSAYVANLTTAAQYNAWRPDSWRDYVHPKLLFVITNPENGEELARYNTDTIAHDWSNYPKSWRESAEWQLVGMNFVVPEGVTEAKLSIRNNAVGSTGNDFALDDIEVRLCVPPVAIIAPDTVCTDTKNTFTAAFENDGTFIEPLEYQWYFSADSITWTPLNDGNEREYKLKAKPRHTGWYQVAVSGRGNINNPNCRSLSDPFYLYVIPDCPPILCPDGYLLFRETFDNPVMGSDTTFHGLCAGMDLSFVVNLPPNHPNTRLLMRLIDPVSGTELATYDTGEVPADSLQVGTNLTVPEGVSDLRWTIRNNKAGSAGQPFTVEDIEIRLCIEPISIQSPDTIVCRKMPFTFKAVYDNYGILENPEYRWSFSPDSATWTDLQTSQEKTYTIPVVHRSDEGWYRVSVADEGKSDMANCRGTSEPFRLFTSYCYTATDRFIDTVACDTLLKLGHTWRGHDWPTVGTVIDTIKDFEDDDSLYVHLTLDSKICCPDIDYYRMDSAVCDTLLPFLWFYRDTMVLFTEIGEQTVEYPHYKWETCTGEIHTLALDTFHCERLYPFIVNKYNWQLLLDYVTLRRIFPERQYLAFQWYKDGEKIDGAIEDDYAEQNELNGSFQLCIRLDQAVDDDDEYIWSNILDIHPVEEPLPVIKRVYDAHGIPVSEQQMNHGVFLIRYEQGDRVWTEKRFIP